MAALRGLRTTVYLKPHYQNQPKRRVSTDVAGAQLHQMSPCSRTEGPTKKNILVNETVDVSQMLGKFLPKTTFQVFVCLGAHNLPPYIKSLIKIVEKTKWKKC